MIQINQSNPYQVALFKTERAIRPLLPADQRAADLVESYSARKEASLAVHVESCERKAALEKGRPYPDISEYYRDDETFYVCEHCGSTNSHDSDADDNFFHTPGCTYDGESVQICSECSWTPHRCRIMCDECGEIYSDEDGEGVCPSCGGYDEND